LHGSALLLAAVFLALHLPYFPQSLEDLDSINFALGVRDFDVTQHQPHPPGYPVYILAAKAAHVIAGSETSALSALSVLAGALGVLAIAALFRRLWDNPSDGPWAVASTLLAVTSPLYWFTAERPLSDMVGLALAIAVQVMTLGARTPRMLYAASFCAGLATGVRSQVASLTVPLIAVCVFEVSYARSSSYVASGFSRTTKGPPEGGRHARALTLMVGAAAAFAAGVLVWAIPLVILTGGPSAYWAALTFQGSADLGNIQMLWTRHGVRDVLDALYFAFVVPWVTRRIAFVVLPFAAVGSIALLMRRPRTLLLLAAAFGPYFIFDVLFQETFTSRYALPLVVPMAFLAAVGLRLLPWQSGAIALAAIAMFDAHIGGTSLAAYASRPAPAFRLLDDMREAARGSPAVLAMDRKQSFDFRRPLVWMADARPAFERTLPAPPQHEWLEAVKYWNGGGRAPVWFVVDPKRTAIDLVRHGGPAAYRWPVPYPVLLGGVRPDEMDWYRVARPEWYVGEGWALTPEAAGVAEADRRDVSHTPIDAWISRDTIGGVLMLGGRNFDSTTQTRLSLTIGGNSPAEFVAPPGPFLQFLPLRSVDRASSPDYTAVTVASSAPVRIALEQFDASARRTIFGFGDGWHEQELNPRTGARWRWLSERGELRFGSATPRLTLHLEGESPRAYFSRGSRLVAKAGDRVVFDDVLTSDFAVDVALPTGTALVTLETDQVFQPADRSRRSADRRHLGLRIFKCELRPAS
jgi:hypothetical protein